MRPIVWPRVPFIETMLRVLAAMKNRACNIADPCIVQQSLVMVDLAQWKQPLRASWQVRHVRPPEFWTGGNGERFLEIRG